MGFLLGLYEKFIDKKECQTKKWVHPLLFVRSVVDTKA